MITETETKVKPTAIVKDAFVIHNRMYAVAISHPTERLNGTKIVTSPIVKRNGTQVETNNTIYTVQNWIEDSLVGREAS